MIYLLLGLGTTGSVTKIEIWHVQYGDLILQIGAILIVTFGLVMMDYYNQNS